VTELLSLSAASAIVGVTPGQLARAARDGRLPDAVRDGGRWKVTEAGARSWAADRPRRGRPMSLGLEVEHVSTYPARPEWRARVGGGEWSTSDTRDRAVKAAHAAARVRRLIEAQRRELTRWRGPARRPTVSAVAPLLAPGSLVVVVRRGRGLRGVVLDVSSSGRALVGWMDGGAVRVGARHVAELREEVK